MIKYIIALSLVCLLIVPPVAAFNDDTWAVAMNGWDYRIPVTISSSPSEENIQIKIDLTYQEHMQMDFDDIRFYTTSGTQISYWIEDYTLSSTATVWVKLPDASTQYIYLYYGNPSAISASNGDTVFDLFDHFDDSTLNTEKWNTESNGAGITDISNSVATFSDGASSSHDVKGIISKVAYNQEYVLEARTKWTTQNGYSSVIGFLDGPYWDNYPRECMGYFTSYLYHVNVANGGTWTYTANPNIINNVWNRLSIDRNNGDVKFWTDGNEIVISSHVYDPSADLSVKVQGDSASSKSFIFYVDWLAVRKYVSTEPSISFGSAEVQTSSPATPTPTPTPTPGLPHATLQARPIASATIAPMDDVGYYLLNTALGLNEQYNESAGTGQLDPRGVFNASTYPFTGGEYGDYASLLIFAVPFLLAWMRQNSAIIPMSFGCILGTWMLWKLPAEWQLPATGMIILSMMGILYGIYKEKY